MNVGAELKGVRSGVVRRRCVSGSKPTVVWAERGDRREVKSLRNGVHNANAVVWGPV
tara:strand:- start:798 stop:968 length:171 start_codon:yes stop_codon:yes gene_type:complete